MWEKVSVFIKLVWKVSLKCQINEIINTRIKQPAFQKIKGKHNHILGKDTKKDFRKAFRIQVSISHPMSYPQPAFIPEFQNLRERHTIKAGHENKC